MIPHVEWHDGGIHLAGRMLVDDMADQSSSLSHSRAVSNQCMQCLMRGLSKFSPSPLIRDEHPSSHFHTALKHLPDQYTSGSPEVSGIMKTSNVSSKWLRSYGERGLGAATAFSNPTSDLNSNFLTFLRVPLLTSSGLSRRRSRQGYW